MKHPLWLINSVLLLFCIAIIGFVCIDTKELPKRTSLVAMLLPTSTSNNAPSFDLTKIYTDDLFETNQEAPIKQVEHQDFGPKLPEAPQQPDQKSITIPEEPQPAFLPPLDIKLKGVICTDNELLNKAIIADNKTNTQTIFKVGEIIQDARLVKILSNKIIIIRSNGQQETLYLNERDLNANPFAKEKNERWLHVVKKLGPERYLFDHESFAHIIKNMAQCIDIFDLTTSYKNGKSIGCKIGFLDAESLGYAMGFESYDTITAIDSLPLTTAEERITLFDHFKTVTFTQTIEINGMRNNEPFSISYILRDLKDPFDELKSQEPSLAGIIIEPDQDELEEEKMNILHQRYVFAPTVEDIKIEQKKAMLEKRKNEGE